MLGMTLGGIKCVDIDTNSSNGGPPVLSFSKNSLLLDSPNRESSFGMIKSMSFSANGRMLALGGEDGSIEIVAWPSLASLARWQASKKAIRNLDFSSAHSDCVIAAVDESGSCILYNVSDGQVLTQLSPPSSFPRATFFRCKSTVDDNGIALYTPIKFKGRGYILRYRQDEDGCIKLEAKSPRPVTSAPVCGFELSCSGRLAAVVTPDGDQCVISTVNLNILRYRKAAHMTFATAVCFSPDEKAILSTSADASATLTKLGADGLVWSWLFTVLALLILCLAILVGWSRRYLEVHPAQLDGVMHFLDPAMAWFRSKTYEQT